MSSSLTRILAAIVMIAILVIVFLLGKEAMLFLTILVGSFLVYESNENIFKKIDRRKWDIVIDIMLYFVLCFLLNYIFYDMRLFFIITVFGSLINMVAMFYLFAIPIENRWLLRVMRKYSFLSSIYFLIIILSMSSIFHFWSTWRVYVILMLLITYGMDSGGWIFGKLFGKHKLWPAVSPNKTIEGVFGGVFLSTVLSLSYLLLFTDQFKLILILIIPFLATISHAGDLFQSKIKRQAGVKNSSSLIPGHGGVYDRVDSLLMISPFYVLIIWMFF